MCIFFFTFFFKLGFTPSKGEHPLQGLMLLENKDEMNKKDTEKLFKKAQRKKLSITTGPKAI